MSSEKATLHDQTNILTGRHLLTVFASLASALLISYIDQNSIAVALPTIGRELNSSSTIVWAGTSSLIANTAFQVLYGRGSDILGRKVMLLTCLGLLALGDLLCGFARTGAQLFAFRGISGLANGGVMALVMMIVSDVTTLEQRGKSVSATDLAGALLTSSQDIRGSSAHASASETPSVPSSPQPSPETPHGELPSGSSRHWPYW